MRKSLRILAAVAVLFILFDVAVAAPKRGPRGVRGERWELLGERAVGDKLDHDTIAVTRKEGNFTALQLRVNKHAVEFHRIVVHFANGDDQEIELRKAIPAGGSSRVIDLEGKNRGIKSVDLWYDARSVAGGRPVVKLFGRH